jgi:hypothetical protein
MEGRGKGMDIETLQKPLPLIRGTGLLKFKEIIYYFFKVSH